MVSVPDFLLNIFFSFSPSARQCFLRYIVLPFNFQGCPPTEFSSRVVIELLHTDSQAPALFTIYLFVPLCKAQYINEHATPLRMLVARVCQWGPSMLWSRTRSSRDATVVNKKLAKQITQNYGVEWNNSLHQQGGVYYCWDDQSKKQICLIYMYLHPIQIQPLFFIPMENSLRDSLHKKKEYL